MVAARKKDVGPRVLAVMHVPPHLTKCHVCGEMVMAYALADDKAPPWYLCEKCYGGMIRST